MNNMPLISIIVPVFNTDKYLSKCLDSILEQSYTDFELLLIDDGSTDDSGRVCDEYSVKDNRIRVFHKANGGVSSARNMGLDKAIGRWIYFFDSDDEMYPDGIEALINGCQKENIDFVTAGYEQFSFEKQRMVTTLLGEIEERILDINDGVKLMYRDVFYQFYTPTKLFKREIIEKIRLRFDESLYFSEDRLFIIKYLCASSRGIYYTTQPIFKYMVRELSAMSSLNNSFNYKSITGFYAALMMYEALCVNRKITRENRRIAINDVMYSYLLTIQNMKSFSVNDELLEKHLKEKLFASITKFDYYFILAKHKLKNIYKMYFVSQ